LPIFRSTRLCVTACDIMHPRCCRPPAGNIVGARVHGCLYTYYLYQWCPVKQVSENKIYLLIKYIKRVLWRAAKSLSYIEDAWCLKVNNTKHKGSVIHGSKTRRWIDRFLDLLMTTF